MTSFTKSQKIIILVVLAAVVMTVVGAAYSKYISKDPVSKGLTLTVTKVQDATLDAGALNTLIKGKPEVTKVVFGDYEDYYAQLKDVEGSPLAIASDTPTARIESEPKNTDTGTIKGFVQGNTLYVMNISTGIIYMQGSITENEMFDGCNALTDIDCSSLNTSSTTSMQNMFRGCTNLTNLEISTLSTTALTKTDGMFKNCTSLSSIDLSGWGSPSKVTSAAEMFKDCTSLAAIYTPTGFNMTSASGTDMFAGDSQLMGGSGSTYDPLYKDQTYARVDGSTSSPGYFSLIKYEIDYNANGGLFTGKDAGDLKVDTHIAGSAEAPLGKFTIISDEPKNEDMAFLGWSADAEATEATYHAGDEYIFTNTSKNTFTLYAVWDEDQDVTVTFDATGGTVDPTEKTVKKDETYGELPTPEREGYTFLGWNYSMLPAGYKQVKYISNEGSGDGYFDTGVYPSKKTGSYIKADYDTTGSDNDSYLLGTAFTTATNARHFNAGITNGYWSAGYMDTPTGSQIAAASATSGTITAKLNYLNNMIASVYDENGNGGSINLSTSSTVTGSDSIRIFRNYGSEAVSGKIYEVQITEGTALIRDYVPAVRLSDSVAGFYDRVTGTFLASADGYAFTPGPVVGSESTSNYVTASTKVETSADHTLYAHWEAVTDATLDKSVMQKTITNYSVKKVVFANAADYSALVAGGSGISMALTTGGVEEPQNTYANTIQGYISGDTLYIINTKKGKIYLPEDSSDLFSGNSYAAAKKLTSIDMGVANTSRTTNMSGMFYATSALEQLNVSGFDTSKVTNMSSMFREMAVLTKLDLSSFDTSKVENMEYMFYTSPKLETIYVSDSFVTKAVTKSGNTFNSDSALRGGSGTAYTGADIAYARIDGGTAAPGCFTAKKYTLTLDANGGSFEDGDLTKQIIHNSEQYPTGTQGLFELPVTGLTAPEGKVFVGWGLTKDATETVADVAAYPMPSSTQTLYAVYKNKQDATLDKTAFTNLITGSSGSAIRQIVFGKRSDLISEIGAVKGTDLAMTTGGVEDDPNTAAGTIRGYIKDTVLYIVNETDGKIYTPADSTSLFAGKDTSGNVRANFAALTKIDASYLDTSRTTGMRGLFYGCTALSELNVSGWNTSQVTDMWAMFGQVAVLTKLDLSSFNTSKVENMQYMFYSSPKLETIYVSDSFVTTAVTTSGYTFDGDSALRGGSGTAYAGADIAYARIDGGTSAPGCFTAKEYKLILDANGGKFADESETKSITQKAGENTEPIGVFDITDHIPAKADHTFTGWADTADAAAAQYTGTYPSKTTNNTIYAVYTYEKDATLDKAALRTLISNNSAAVKKVCFVTLEEYLAKSGTETNLALTSGGVEDEQNTDPATIKGMICGDTLYIANKTGGTLYAPADSSQMFYNLTGLEQIDTKTLNTGRTTNFSQMFGFSQSGYTTLKKIDVSTLNTAKAENMYRMFLYCEGITSLDLSSFDTANATNMNNMLAGLTNCATIYASDAFVTSKVTDDTNMFGASGKLTGGSGTAYNSSDVNKTRAHIDGGTDDPGYFTAKSYTLTLNAGAGEFDDGKKEQTITHTAGKDTEPIGKITLPINGPSLSGKAFVGWAKTQGVEDPITTPYYEMPQTATATLYAVYRDVQDATISKDALKTYVQSKGGSIKKILIGTKAEYASFIEGCTSTDLAMAADAAGYARVEDTKNEKTDTIKGYLNGDTLYIINITGGKIYAPDNASQMFDGRNYTAFRQVTDIDASGLNTSRTTNMSLMFDYLLLLKNVDVSSFDTSLVTSMEGMFKDNDVLEMINVSSFDTHLVTNFNQMFYSSPLLKTIYASEDFTIGSTSTSSYMFYEDSGLVGGSGTKFSSSYITANRAHIDGGTANPGYFTARSYTLTLDAADGEFADGTKQHTITKTAGKDTEPIGKITLPTVGPSLDNRTFVGWATTPDATEPIATTYYEMPSGTTATLYAVYVGKQDATLNKSSVSSAMTSAVKKIKIGSRTRYAEFLEGITPVNLAYNSGTTRVEDEPKNTNAGTIKGYINGDTLYIVNVTDGKIYTPADASSFFDGYNTTGNYKNVTEFDASGLDTSRTTKMSAMFNNCTALTTLDVSSFDTSKVTDMSSMFATCSAIEKLDLTNFNTSAVKNMGSMFYNDGKLTTIYVSDTFTNAAVTSPGNMFYNCKTLVGGGGTTFDSSYINAARALIDSRPEAPGYLTAKVYTLTLNANGGSFEDGSKESKTYIHRSETYTEGYPGVFALPSVMKAPEGKVFAGWGASADAVDTYDYPSAFASPKATFTVYAIYKDATDATLNKKLFLTFINNTAINKIVFGTRSQYAEQIASGTGVDLALTVDTDSTNGPRIEENKNTYAGTIKGYVIGDTAYIINETDGKLFAPKDCAYLMSGNSDNNSAYATFRRVREIDASGLSTSGTTNMRDMFNNCNIAINIDVSGFDTSNATAMNGMFVYCYELEKIDLSSFDTKNVTEIGAMFTNDNKLKTIYASNSFTVDKVTSSGSAFSRATVLVGGSGTAYNGSYVDKNRAHIDGGDLNPGYFTAKVYRVTLNPNGGSFEDDSTESKVIVRDSETYTEGYPGIFALPETMNAPDGKIFAGWGTSATALETIARPSAYACTYDTVELFAIYKEPQDATLSKSAFKTFINNTAINKIVFGTRSQYAEQIASGTGVDLALTVDTDSTNGPRIEENKNTYAGTIKGYVIGDTAYIINETDGELFAPKISSYIMSGNKDYNPSAYTTFQRVTSIDASGLNTFGTTKMEDVFNNCDKAINIDVSGFNTSNVTAMNGMFASCDELEKIDLSSFDTKQVTNIVAMFLNDDKLKTIYVSDSFTVGAGTSSESAFSGATMLVGGSGTAYDRSYLDKSRAHIDGGNLDPGYFTAKVYTLTLDPNGGSFSDGTFEAKSYRRNSLTYTAGYPGVFEIPTEMKAPAESGKVFVGWATSPTATDAQPGCSTYSMRHTTETLYAIYKTPQDATLNKTAFKDIVTGNSTVKKIIFGKKADLVDKITNASYYDIALTVDTDTTNGPRIEENKNSNAGAIRGYLCADTLYIVNETDGKIYAPQNSSYLFSGTNFGNLVEIDTSILDTTGTTNMSYMFSGASALHSLNISGFNTAKVTNMSYMFNSCAALEELDLTGFNTALVTEMSNMFSSCTALEVLDLSSFDTAKLTNMNYTFYNCGKLRAIYASEQFVTTNVTATSNMFNGDSKLKGGYGTAVSTTDNKLYARIDKGTAAPGYFTAPSYTVIFEASGGTFAGGTDSLTVTHTKNTAAEPIALFALDESVLPEKEGYALIGWSYRPGATVPEYPAGTDYTALYLSGGAANKLYAVWSDEKFTVTLDANGGVISATSDWKEGSGGVISREMKYGMKYGDLPTPKDSVRDFGGWAYISSNGTKFVDGDTTVVVSQDHTLTAVWKQNATVNKSTMISFINNNSASNLVFGNLKDYQDVVFGLTGTDMAVTSGGVEDGVKNTLASTIKGYYKENTVYVLNTTNGQIYTPASCYQMFYNNGNLVSIDMRGVNTSKTTDMSQMFYNMSKLREVNLSGIDTSAVTNMSYMFASSGKLETITLDGIRTDYVTNMNAMFYDLPLLKTLDLSSFNTQRLQNTANMFSECKALETIYASENFVTSSITNGGSMFYSCTSLTGGSRTVYSASYVDQTRARIDGGSQLPGYFTATEYTLKYDAAGGAFDDGKTIHTFSVTKSGIIPGGKFTVASDAPTYGELTFRGWSEKPGSSDVLYHAGDDYVVSYDGTSATTNMLYAVWDEITRVGFDAAGGSIPKGSSWTVSGSYAYKDVTYGAAYGELPTPEKNGSIFKGWYLDGVGMVDRWSVVSTTEDHMLTAVWGKDATIDMTTLKTQINNNSVKKLVFGRWSDYASKIIGVTGVQMALTSGGVEDAPQNTDAGAIMGYIIGEGDNKTMYVLNQDDGRIYTPADATGMLSGTALTEVDATYLNTSRTTNMKQMFYNMKYLTKLDVSTFDTSLVRDFTSMFNSCTTLTELDLTSFDTGSATTFQTMFNNMPEIKVIYANDSFVYGTAGGSDIFNSDTKLTGGSGTLYSSAASGTNSSKYLHIDGGTTNPGLLSLKSYKLTLNANGGTFSGGDEVTYHHELGEDEAPLGVFALPSISDSKAPTREGYVFAGWGLSSNANEIITDIAHYGARGGTDTVYAIWKTPKAATIDKKTLRSVLEADHAITEVIFGTRDDLASVVGNATAIPMAMTSGGVEDAPLNTAATTINGYKVGNKLYIFNVTGGKIYTPADCSVMFGNASGTVASALNWLTNIDFGAKGVVNTSRTTNMEAMFCGCTSLKTVNLEGFDTAAVTSIKNMFWKCSSIEVLDLSSFDMRALTTVQGMFSHMTALKTIYASELFAPPSTATGNDVFNADSLLVGGSGTTYNSTIGSSGVTYLHIDGGASNPGMLSLKSYTLTYDANGGEFAGGATKAEDTHKVDTSADPLGVFTLKSGEELPTYPGMTFVGWSTTKSGNSMISGSTYAMSKGAATVYAIWSSGTVAFTQSEVVGGTSYTIDSAVDNQGITFTQTTSESYEKLVVPINGLSVGAWYELIFNYDYTSGGSASMYSAYHNFEASVNTYKNTDATNAHNYSQSQGYGTDAVDRGYTSAAAQSSASQYRAHSLTGAPSILFYAANETMYLNLDNCFLANNKTYTLKVGLGSLLPAEISSSGARVDYKNAEFYNVVLSDGRAFTKSSVDPSEPAFFGTALVTADDTKMITKQSATSGQYDHVIIPVEGLTSGKTYTLDFDMYIDPKVTLISSGSNDVSLGYAVIGESQLTAAKANSAYINRIDGFEVLASKDATTGVLGTSHRTVSFTADGETMYLAFDLSAVTANSDAWYDFNITNSVLQAGTPESGMTVHYEKAQARDANSAYYTTYAKADIADEKGTFTGNGIALTTKTGVSNQKLNIPISGLTKGKWYNLTYTRSALSTSANSNPIEAAVTKSTQKDNSVGLTSQYYDTSNMYSRFQSRLANKAAAVTDTFTFYAEASDMNLAFNLACVPAGCSVTYKVDAISKLTGTVFDPQEGDTYVDVVNATQGVADVSVLFKYNQSEIGAGVTKVTADSICWYNKLASGYERMNVPIKGLKVGQKYTLSFSTERPGDTTFSTTNNSGFGYEISATAITQNSDHTSGGASTAWNKIIDGKGLFTPDTTVEKEKLVDGKYCSKQEVTFTATEKTMYICFQMGGLNDNDKANAFAMKDIKLEKNTDTEPHVNLAAGIRYFAPYYVNVNASIVSIDEATGTVTYSIKCNDSYEKLNIPIENLESGAMYEITYSYNPPESVYSDHYKESGVLASPCTNTGNATITGITPQSARELVSDREYCNYYFRATAETMYLAMSLNVMMDNVQQNLTINGVSIRKVTEPESAYADLSAVEANDKLSLRTRHDGADINTLTEIHYGMKGVTGYEKCNIPLKNLIQGHVYKLSWKEKFSVAGVRTYTKVSASKITDGGSITFYDNKQLSTTEYSARSLFFAAEADTMYWAHGLSEFGDSNWINWDMQDITVTDLGAANVPTVVLTPTASDSSWTAQTQLAYTGTSVSDASMTLHYDQATGINRHMCFPIRNLTPGNYYTVSFDFGCDYEGSVNSHYEALGYKITDAAYTSDANSTNPTYFTQWQPLVENDYADASTVKTGRHAYTFLATGSNMYISFEFYRLSLDQSATYSMGNFLVEGAGSGPIVLPKNTEASDAVSQALIGNYGDGSTPKYTKTDTSISAYFAQASGSNRHLCIPMVNLTPGEEYTVSFDFGCSETGAINKMNDALGFKVTDAADKSDSTSSDTQYYKSWQSLLEDADAASSTAKQGHYTYTFTATASKMYLNFEFYRMTAQKSALFTLSNFGIVTGSLGTASVELTEDAEAELEAMAVDEGAAEEEIQDEQNGEAAEQETSDEGATEEVIPDEQNSEAAEQETSEETESETPIEDPYPEE